VNRQQDVPVSEFLDRLSKSGILSEGELNEVSATINVDREADVRRFAQELVEKRMLTDWQTRVLCGSEDGELAIGEYVILEHIDEGGMGRVYKARHRQTAKIVAVKLLNPQSASDESAVRRFKREIETASRLKHPNIVATLGSGEIRVLDMGLARIAGDIGPGEQTQTQITKTGSIMGTVDFMAPEQALNPKKADRRADIYSLGCTLFFLLTGEKPYPGETVMEVLVAHREAPVPSLTAARKDVPPSLETVFQKMVAKEPDDRYQSMSEVVSALESCLAEHGLAWLMQKVKSGRR
jgi:serine/threonine protein kinase